MNTDSPKLCADCGSPLDSRQGYCLNCGARVGPRSPQLVELLARINGHSHDGSAPTARPIADVGAGGPHEPPREGERVASRPTGLTLPPPRVSALLVLLFLGFGVLIGNAASSSVKDSLAASRQPVRLVLSSPSATASTTSTPSSSSSSSSSSEAPEAEAEAAPTPTPTPAPKTTSTTSAPAKAPATSGGKSTPAESTAGEGESGQAPARGSSPKQPAIKHVFVIMLSDEPYASVFGPASPARYLSHTLEQRGELLAHYDAVAHEELANEVALLSGQGPTTETAANCPDYTEITPTGAGADEQVLGSGCVYPSSTQTLPGQLTAKHLRWRAYVEGMDEPGATAGACAHPTLGQPDPTAVQTTSSGPYATFRNPFVYFQSLSGSPQCAADDVGMDSLQADLSSPTRTPNFSYIVPDRCNDGNPTPCNAGAPAGLVPADGFLQKVVPEIMDSKAYKQSGLLVITVDEAPSGGEFADSSSCCGQPQFPNVPASTTLSGSPRGGGAVGALLLSPFIKGASTSQEPYNHFSLLRTIEDVFSLKHLGYAALPGVKSFEASIFSG